MASHASCFDRIHDDATSSTNRVAASPDTAPSPRSEPASGGEASRLALGESPRRSMAVGVRIKGDLLRTLAMRSACASLRSSSSTLASKGKKKKKKLRGRLVGCSGLERCAP